MDHVNCNKKWVLMTMNFHLSFIVTIVVFFVNLCDAFSLHRHHEIPNPNIIGGRPAEIWEFPYQVSIQYLNEHNCGGSIISPRHILSAAHCFDDVKPEETTVRAGSSVILNGGVLMNVKEIHSHPKFIAVAYDFDIAIVELEQDLTFDKNIQSIQLPAENYSVKANSIGTLTGWGATDPYSMDMSNQLMTVNVPIISDEECNADYPTFNLNERQMCAGFQKGGKDSCLGDSGGPLVAQGLQVGIVSYGKICAAPKEPGVYTRLSDPGMRKFIKEITGI